MNSWGGNQKKKEKKSCPKVHKLCTPHDQRLPSKLPEHCRHLLTNFKHVDSAGIPWCTLGYDSVAVALVKGVEETVVGQRTSTVESFGSLDHVKGSL